MNRALGFPLIMLGFRPLLFVVAIAPLTTLGCGDGHPDRVAVSGHVFIDGQPLTAGTIKFIPEGARPSSGTIDETGRFTLTCYDGGDGVVRGRHRVAISAMELVGSNKVKWLAPRKYADFRTSELAFEITEPTDDLRIELSWNGGKPFVQ